MLSADAVINLELLADVIASGHSRVPVYEGDRQVRRCWEVWPCVLRGLRLDCSCMDLLTSRAQRPLAGACV